MIRVLIVDDHPVVHDGVRSALNRTADIRLVQAAETIPQALAALAQGRLDVAAVLRELGRRRFTNLLVEGGGEVLASFLAADAIDEAHVFVAPKLVGGKPAPTPLGGAGIAQLADASRFPHTQVRVLDGDVYIHALR